MEHWPHGPPHRILSSGTYMVTSGTYNKLLYFHSHDRLQFLHNNLLKLTKDYGWELQAWAVFANHYHFIAKIPNHAPTLPSFIANLHTTTARYINKEDNMPERKVWHQYWDSQITYPYSYFARLNYVNQNPVKHGLVDVATQYPWCSANWFEKTTPLSFYKTVANFKTDKVNVRDDF